MNPTLTFIIICLILFFIFAGLWLIRALKKAPIYDEYTDTWEDDVAAENLKDEDFYE